MLSYRNQHHPSSSEDVLPRPGQPFPLEPVGTNTSSLVGQALEPGLSFDRTSTLHVRQRRRLRAIELQTSEALQLLHNGQSVCLLTPGQNLFDPVLQLEAGDVLQLQLLANDGGRHV